MKTTIIAVRHAEPFSDGHADETLRPLSKHGIATHTMITKKIQDASYPVEQILTSPILRAVETAQIMGKILDIEIEKEAALGYEFDSGLLLKLLRTSTILVGHAPYLAHFVNQLAGKVVLPKGLPTSGAAVISFDDSIEFGQGKLENYFKP